MYYFAYQEAYAGAAPRPVSSRTNWVPSLSTCHLQESTPLLAKRVVSLPVSLFVKGAIRSHGLALYHVLMRQRNVGVGMPLI